MRFQPTTYNFSHRLLCICADTRTPSDELQQSDSNDSTDTTHVTLQQVIEIDSRGDLKLIVGDEKVHYLVCSRTLARSASYWNNLLYGPFVEANSTEDGIEWVIRIEEDEPRAFEALMLVVHGQVHKLQHLNIDLDLAFEITVLADKYRMKHCLWNRARDWLAGLKLVRCSRRDGGTALSYYEWTLPLLWLWITQEVGDLEQYTTALKEMTGFTAWQFGLNGGRGREASSHSAAHTDLLRSPNEGAFVHGKCILPRLEGMFFYYFLSCLST